MPPSLLNVAGQAVAGAALELAHKGGALQNFEPKRAQELGSTAVNLANAVAPQTVHRAGTAVAGVATAGIGAAHVAGGAIAAGAVAAGHAVAVAAVAAAPFVAVAAAGYGVYKFVNWLTD